VLALVRALVREPDAVLDHVVLVLGRPQVIRGRAQRGEVDAAVARGGGHLQPLFRDERGGRRVGVVEEGHEAALLALGTDLFHAPREELAGRHGLHQVERPRRRASPLASLLNRADLVVAVVVAHASESGGALLLGGLGRRLEHQLRDVHRGLAVRRLLLHQLVGAEDLVGRDHHGGGLELGLAQLDRLLEPLHHFHGGPGLAQLLGRGEAARLDRLLGRHFLGHVRHRLDRIHHNLVDGVGFPRGLDPELALDVVAALGVDDGLPVQEPSRLAPPPAPSKRTGGVTLCLGEGHDAVGVARVGRHGR